MSYKDNEIYDFVIVGAGPSGLTAGITAGRLGLNPIILEKGKIAGSKPRGEGMGHYPIVDEILGKDFLPSIGFKSNGERVWHSPADLKTTTTIKIYPHYFFEWRKFINKFVETINKLGIEIRYECEVIEPLEIDSHFKGIKYIDKNGKADEVFGNSILDCSGYSTKVGRYFNIPFDDKINCPIIKCLISKANLEIYDSLGLQFYLIGNGDLEYSPHFPQCVAYVFPLENKRAEVGLMLRMAQARKMKTVKIPTQNEIMKVWERIKKEYPGFSQVFDTAKIDYEELTHLPNAQFVDNYIPAPGVVLIGDCAGFVNSSGSSGLYYSMEMANFWVNILSKKFEELKKDGINASDIFKSLWSDQNVSDYKNKFENTEAYKQVMHYYNLIGAFEYKIFNRLRTSEKINAKWEYISSLLEQA